MELRELDESLLSELLLGMGEGVIITDEFGRIETVNRAAEKLFGYHSAELAGQSLDMLLPVSSRKHHTTHMQSFGKSPKNRLFMGGRPKIRGVRKDGTEFLIKAFVSKITHLGEAYFVSIVMDQTEHDRLTKTERSLANAQRVARLGDWEMNIRTGELWWSDEIYHILGQQQGDFEPSYKEFLKVVHAEDRDRVKRAFDAAVNEGMDYGIVHRVVQATGKIRTVREEGEVTLDANGTPIILHGTVQDITEQTETEARLRQAQNLESVGQLTGGIAHDFNNLLMVIMGNLELLKYDLEDLPSSTQLIDAATNAARRGTELTQRLLAFARRQALHPEVVDLRHLLREMNPILRRTMGENIDIEMVGGAGLWRCETDISQLENAILNIVINAHDAMPDGGKLTIETGNAYLDDEFALTHTDINPGQYVLLSVSDTGHGMTAEIMKQVFEPFFTTKEAGRGSGLGLSMVYGFITQSGGCVQLYSEIDEGTTVKIYLPRTRRATDDTGNFRKLAGEPQGSGEHILVVEDDSAVLKLAVELLERLGYRTSQAENAQQAMEILESDQEIMLLLTDVILSGGKNGAELAAAALGKWPELQVLYMSGYTENAIVHQGRLDDGIQLLAKPFTKLQLSRKVRKAFAQRPAQTSDD